MSDLIEREDAINEMAEYIGCDFARHEDAVECARSVMEQIPSARPKGEWRDMGDFEQCSVCKGTRLKEFQSYYGKTTWVKTPYCPNCGADMREREDE